MKVIQSLLALFEDADLNKQFQSAMSKFADDNNMHWDKYGGILYLSANETEDDDPGFEINLRQDDIELKIYHDASGAPESIHRLKFTKSSFHDALEELYSLIKDEVRHFKQTPEGKPINRARAKRNKDLR